MQEIVLINLMNHNMLSYKLTNLLVLVPKMFFKKIVIIQKVAIAYLYTGIDMHYHLLAVQMILYVLDHVCMRPFFS